MRYIINAAGNRIVVASPEETHALRPCIVAYLRRHGCPPQWLDDCAQDVELIVWQSIVDRRVQGDRATKPENALLRFVFMTSWYVWKNHSRRRAGWYEILADDPPEMVGPCPMPCLEARDALRRISAEPRTTHALLAALNGAPKDTPRTTQADRVTRARHWAREVVAEPKQPMPFTWKQRKKGR